MKKLTLALFVILTVTLFFSPLTVARAQDNCSEDSGRSVGCSCNSDSQCGGGDCRTEGASEGVCRDNSQDNQTPTNTNTGTSSTPTQKSELENAVTKLNVLFPDSVAKRTSEPTEIKSILDVFSKIMSIFFAPIKETNKFTTESNNLGNSFIPEGVQDTIQVPGNKPEDQKTAIKSFQGDLGCKGYLGVSLPEELVGPEPCSDIKSFQEVKGNAIAPEGINPFIK